MSDYRKVIEEHSCKPSQGCGTATTCMCALAEDMAEEIERLREALRDIIAIPNSEAAQGIMKVIARAALGEGKE